MIDVEADFLSSSELLSRDVDALYQNGMRYQQEKRYDRALLNFKRLLEINPNHPQALTQLALTYYSDGKPREAVPIFQRALKLLPGDPAILNGLAVCYNAQGRFDKAIGYTKKALKAEPGDTAFMYNLVLLEDYSPGSSMARNLLNMYQSSACSPAARTNICFALGKIYENYGDHRRAFPYYAEANRLYFSQASYNETGIFTFFDEIQSIYDAALFDLLKGVGSLDPTPIFVLGMPRSGTTLVEQVLASHSRVYGAGEADIMPRIAEWIVPQFTGLRYPHGLDKLSPDVFTRLAGQYLESLRSYCPGSRPHIAVKTLNNFFHIGLIRILFPKATIIHCIREPMDNCWSMFRQHFAGVHPYSYDQAALGSYYCRYRRLMRHWHQLLPGEIHDVNYEQMVTQPEATIRELLSHCRLTWEPGCLAFYRTQRDVITASARQVRRPIYSSSLASWKPVEQELAILRAALQPCYDGV